MNVQEIINAALSEEGRDISVYNSLLNEVDDLNTEIIYSELEAAYDGMYHISDIAEAGTFPENEDFKKKLNDVKAWIGEMIKKLTEALKKRFGFFYRKSRETKARAEKVLADLKAGKSLPKANPDLFMDAKFVYYDADSAKDIGTSLNLISQLLIKQDHALFVYKDIMVPIINATDMDTLDKLVKEYPQKIVDYVKKDIGIRHHYEYKLKGSKLTKIISGDVSRVKAQRKQLGTVHATSAITMLEYLIKNIDQVLKYEKKSAAYEILESMPKALEDIAKKKEGDDLELYRKKNKVAISLMKAYNDINGIVTDAHVYQARTALLKCSKI